MSAGGGNGGDESDGDDGMQEEAWTIGVDLLDGEESEVIEKLGRIVKNIELRMERGTAQQVREAAEDLAAICSAVDREEQEEQEEHEHQLDAQREAVDALDDYVSDSSPPPIDHFAVEGVPPPRTPESPVDAKHASTQERQVRTVAWRRREILASSPKVASGLVRLLHSSDFMAAVTACWAIAGLCQNHFENASSLGKTPRLLDGVSCALCSRRVVQHGHGNPDDSQQIETAATSDIHDVAVAEAAHQELGESGFEPLEMKEAACQAYVHLAMQNRENKLGIVRCRGVLEALRGLLADSSHPDTQDTAAMVIANCADNFAAGGGAEAARAIVSTPGLLSALCGLVCQSVWSFTDSADRSAGLAAVISLSDHVGAVHELRQAGFVDALGSMLNSDGMGIEYDAMRAEALMALANIVHDVGKLAGGEYVLASVVHLSACSVLGRRGEGQAPIWAVRECLRPLVRLTVNESNRACLARSDEALRVLIILVKRRTPRGGPPTDVEEEVALALIALARLLECDIRVHRMPVSAGLQQGKMPKQQSGSSVLNAVRVEENEQIPAQLVGAAQTQAADEDNFTSGRTGVIPSQGESHRSDVGSSEVATQGRLWQVEEPPQNRSPRVGDRLARARGIKAALQLIASHPNPPSTWQV